MLIEQTLSTWLPWPLSGRTRTLNVAAYCAPVSSILAGQQRIGR